MTDKLGFTTLVSDTDNPKQNDINSASMGLGGLTRGVSTVEMAAAYAAFVNQGVYNEPRTYSKVTDQDGKTVIDNTGDSLGSHERDDRLFHEQIPASGGYQRHWRQRRFLRHDRRR